MSATIREEPGPGLALAGLLEQLTGTACDVGITAPDGGDAGDHLPDGQPLAELMARHEFGLGVPERAVLRPATIEAHDALAGAAREAVGAAIESKDLAKASEALGPILLKAMQDRMTGGVDPPLQPSEDEGPEARGPGDTPLVATGQLLRGLQWAHRARLP